MLKHAASLETHPDLAGRNAGTVPVQPVSFECGRVASETTQLATRTEHEPKSLPSLKNKSTGFCGMSKRQWIIVAVTTILAAIVFGVVYVASESAPSGSTADGDDETLKCEPGAMPQGGACVSCLAGMYNDGNAGECIHCPRGQYQPAIGEANCTNCAAGRYQPVIGQGVCRNCTRTVTPDRTGCTSTRRRVTVLPRDDRSQQISNDHHDPH